ncbi:Cytochrome c oxidase assembly factor 5 [Aphelenchoides besseyi]|nr:Cytochrome c oxidase assembly factor 5 [Aphelenchoides besseyi]KAI6210211.1 Cytochrome c oxidase assembly factor 5 [Aphelenchoides besseyi]
MASLRRSVDQEFEDEELAKQEKTGRSCDRLRLALKDCIKQSHCVQIDRRPAKECINAHDGTVPDRCFTLATMFSDCKRSLVDMRSRFRGRKGDM